MNKLVVASLTAFALASGSALAADLNMPLKAPPAPPPEVSWTGCYVNAGYGYGFFDQQHNPEVAGTPLAPEADTGGRGWLGRFGGGCDYQFGLGTLGNFVVGALADYDVMDLHGEMNLADTPFYGEEKERNAWYAGGRLGYLVTPNLLTFVSGGYTETHFNQIATGSSFTTFSPDVASNTYHGWFLGGGTEYALTFNWLPISGLFWRNEWRYAGYQSDNLSVIGNPGAVTLPSMHSQIDVQTVTSSLVWRFNWTGAPVASGY